MRALLKLLFWCQAAAIGWFALVGGAAQAELEGVLGVGDLALHVAAFLSASATAFLLWPPLRVALLALLAAAAIEAAHAVLPGRDAALADFLASSAGVAAGALAVRLLWPPLVRRLFAAPR
jgi:hypothetical protein